MLRKLFICTLFSFIFILPLFIQYKNNGILFSGNISLLKSKKIREIDAFFQFSYDHFFESLNIFNNGIFIFFIAALIFNLILKFIK
jgi:hypothetical protein